MLSDFEVKDSGARTELAGGFVRDVEDEKPDLTLVPREGVYRYAWHLTRGAKKYGENNWRLACDRAAYKRFRRSAHRHFFQYLDGERDEDHASATKFNLDAAEYVLAILNREEWALKLLCQARIEYGIPLDSDGVDVSAYVEPGSET